MPPTRPRLSRPDGQLLARWAPWIRGVRDDLPPVADGFFEPGVTCSEDGSTITLYDEIGFWGATATEFADAMRQANPDSVTLRLNSPGGDVFDGLAIRSQIAAHGNVDVVVDGIAASAASFLTTAARNVAMMPGSQMMVHDALGLVVGNAEDMRRMVDLLDLQSDNIADLYAARAGGTRDDWRAIMQAEQWYLAGDAVDAGLADEVIAPDDGAEVAEAPADRLRMAWHEWIRAYAGREQTPPPDPPAPQEPVRPAATAFPWDPDSVIRAVEQGR